VLVGLDLGVVLLSLALEAVRILLHLHLILLNLYYSLEEILVHMVVVGFEGL